MHKDGDLSENDTIRGRTNADDGGEAQFRRQQQRRQFTLVRPDWDQLCKVTSLDSPRAMNARRRVRGPLGRSSSHETKNRRRTNEYTYRFTRCRPCIMQQLSYVCLCEEKKWSHTGNRGGNVHHGTCPDTRPAVSWRLLIPPKRRAYSFACMNE